MRTSYRRHYCPSVGLSVSLSVRRARAHSSKTKKKTELSVTVPQSSTVVTGVPILSSKYQATAHENSRK